MAFHAEKYCFRPVSLFEGLPADETRMLKKQMQRTELKKGNRLFAQGDYSQGVYLLQKGKIKIFQLDPDGREQIAYLYGRNEMLGYRPLLSRETHPVTATAVEDCQLLFIPGHSFLQVLDRSIRLSRKIHDCLAHEFSVWINTFTMLAQQPARERLALTLLILNEKYRKKENEKTPVIQLPRLDLASYTRITIETLARLLGQFRKQQWLHTEGRKIMLLRPDCLGEIAEP